MLDDELYVCDAEMKDSYDVKDLTDNRRHVITLN